MKRSLFAAVSAVAACLITFNAAAQSSIFENPKNLQALPEDISPQELRETMRGFSFALDARCTHCHVQEETGQDTRTVFDRDDKEGKRLAREMIRMVQSINKTVSGLDRGADYSYTQVTCTTCHRGQRKPVLVQTVLDEALAEGGAASAIEAYEELKARYFGGHTYDFTGVTLSIYAEDLARAGSRDDGLELALYSQETNPDVPYVHATVGNFYMEMERFNDAAEAYRKSLEIEDRPWVQDLLREAKAAANGK